MRSRLRFRFIAAIRNSIAAHGTRWNRRRFNRWMMIGTAQSGSAQSSSGWRNARDSIGPSDQCSKTGSALVDRSIRVWQLQDDHGDRRAVDRADAITLPAAVLVLFLEQGSRLLREVVGPVLASALEQRLTPVQVRVVVVPGVVDADLDLVLAVLHGFVDIRLVVVHARVVEHRDAGSRDRGSAIATRVEAVADAAVGVLAPFDVLDGAIDRL